MEARRRHRKSGLGVRLVVVWYAFVAFLLPALHLHVSDLAPSCVSSISTSTCGENVPTLRAAETSHVDSGVENGGDRCLLCDWLSVGFTPPTYRYHNPPTAAMVSPTIEARFTSLCQRPVPQQILRGPPARPYSV